MSEHDPFKFDEFFAEAQKREKAREELEVTVNRFTLFLIEQGVIFNPDAFIENSNDSFSPLELIQLRSEASNNHMHVHNLASLKLITEVITQQGKGLPKDYKKRLQAQEIADRSPQPWIDLIDNEFEGEPLSDEDTELIVNQLLEVSQLRARSDEELNQAEINVSNYLQQLGRFDLSFEETVAVKYIGYLIATDADSRKFGRNSNSIEEAHLFAIEHNLDMEVWGKVITRFFN